MVPVQQPAQQVAEAPAAPARPSYVEPVTEVRSPGILPSVLPALLFFVLGALLGVGGYYYWLKSQPEPVVEPTPPITEMKSNNTTLTAFEDGRRLVDKDPAGYINANAASLQTAEDYFLMGRAFMLTGKYWEAKRSFNDSRNRLASADPLNAKTLASEISMALAIIESPQATESFTRDINTANAASSANTNASAANGNSAVPMAGQPLR